MEARRDTAETTVHEWEEETHEPLKGTELVRRDSVVSLRKTFSGDLELVPTNEGPLGIIKGPIPKTAAHATILDTNVHRNRKVIKLYFCQKKLILESLISLFD